MFSSFIIGFHTRRLDNVLQTIRFLELWHKEVVAKSELILICQDRCGNIDNSFASSKLFNLEVDNMHLPKLSNFGVEQATSENIVMLESDRILPARYFEDAISILQPNQQVTTKHMLKLRKFVSDDEIIQGNFPFHDEYRSETNELCTRNMWSGNTLFKKADFLRAGKMDEAYIGYGWADHDMTASMEKVGVKSIFRDEIELHLYHEPLTYGNGDQKRFFIDNGLYYCRKWGQSLPNMLRTEISNYSRILI